MKLLISLAVIFVSAAGYAQEQSAPKPAFDVASVRLSEPDSLRVPGPRFETSHGSLTIRGLSLRYCIVLAYQVQPQQVSAPAWLEDVRLDILAKAPEQTDDKQLYVMVQSLLA